jgi:uncharacterized protein YmfQ (DUF2313 family)
MGIAFDRKLTLAQLEQGHRIFVDHAPRGRIWDALGAAGTPDYALASAIGAMHAYIIAYYDYVKLELNPYTTTDLISEWETSVGLPNQCTLNNVQTIVDRRKQVIYRLQRKPIVTIAQIVDTVLQLTGNVITIKARSDPTNIYFTSANDRFIFDVFFAYVDPTALDGGVDLDGTGDPTLYEFDGKDYPYIIECIVNSLKPANTIAVYRYN